MSVRGKNRWPAAAPAHDLMGSSFTRQKTGRSVSLLCPPRSRPNLQPPPLVKGEGLATRWQHVVKQSRVVLGAWNDGARRGQVIHAKKESKSRSHAAGKSRAARGRIKITRVWSGGEMWQAAIDDDGVDPPALGETIPVIGLVGLELQLARAVDET